jgi:hypothetical protein
MALEDKISNFMDVYCHSSRHTGRIFRICKPCLLMARTLEFSLSNVQLSGHHYWAVVVFVRPCPSPKSYFVPRHAYESEIFDGVYAIASPIHP